MIAGRVRCALRARLGRVVGLAALAVSCASGLRVSDPAPRQPADVAEIRFLGVGGFLIRVGDEAVMTSPMYSNPGLFDEAFTSIYPRADRISRFHTKGAAAADLSAVRAIVVGHAHYDHLMDVPYLLADSPKALVIGNTTMRNVLHAYTDPPASGIPREFPTPIPKIDENRLVALNDPADDRLDTRKCAGENPSPDAPSNRSCMAYSNKKGKPYDVGLTIRISGFCSRHPAQLKPIHQAPGCQPAPLTHLPVSISDYLEGETLAYLIDFIDPHTKKIRFRVYYQDAPSDGGFGQIPDDVLAEHPVNVALLCVGNWKAVENHDADCIVCNLRPDYVILGHWENFFRPQNKRILPAPLQSAGQYQRLIERRMTEIHGPSGKDRVFMPNPQVLKVFTLK